MPAFDERELDGETFADGNMADVVRCGSSFFRGRAPWSDAAHQVLRHLEERGVRWSPRLVSVTEAHEELSFLPGESIPAGLEGYEDEAYLVQLGRLIREMHVAMADFRLAPGTECVPMMYAPESPAIVCHQDIGPWNVIVENEAVTGLIDWDLVGPATPVWELAYAAWRFAPIYPEGRTCFSPGDQAGRISLLLDAYELPEAGRKEFVDVILHRMKSAIDTVEDLGRAGVSGFSRLLESGLHLSGHDDAAWLQKHRADFDRILERRVY